MHRSVAIGLLVVGLVTGCAQQTELVARSAQVSAGMSASQVQQLLGPPQNRQFSGNDEAWQYCETDYTGFAGDQYTLIWLRSGRVTGLERYTNTLVGTCETYFRQVNFGDGPDMTVEFRYR